MTGTIWKLSAGDGYTYLTRQVAAMDSTERARSELSDYYSDKGEVPGIWRGAGIEGLSAVRTADGETVALREGDQVTEAHMRALFGEGIHPLADLIDAAHAAEPEVAAAQRKLGRAYLKRDSRASPFDQELAVRYRAWLDRAGLDRNGSVPDQVRAEIRTELATELFTKTFGRAPLNERELSGHVAKVGRPQSDAVAGFDVTFSPVKSVSVLWALADPSVAEQVVNAHDAAVDAAMSYLESECAYTRRGAGGVRHEDVRGLLAAQFRHRDSRSGDPDLHTHVAISNKVQAADGTWCALDGSVLYRAMVSVSERYNTALESELRDRLGVDFAPREGGRENGPAVREVVGISQDLCESMSARRHAIVTRRAELEQAFRDRHGRVPTPKELLDLAQQANLETRDAKHEPRAESEQRAAWSSHAVAQLGTEQAVTAMVDQALGRSRTVADVPSTAELQQLGAEALATVSRNRARFGQRHLRAEVERIVRGRGLSASAALRTVTDAVTATLGSDEVIALTASDGIEEPAALRRADGESVYAAPQGRLFTSQAVLDAEQRILNEAGRRDRVRVDETTLSVALLESVANGVELNPGQEAMVRDLATSGARAQLLLAPAGSGKTTALGVLRRAWGDAGGQVVALAPSAAAARELGAAVDAPADTLAKLVWHLEHPDAPAPEWVERIDSGTLIVVDEAGMAATHDLDTLLRFAAQREASVRLIGDDQQLAAIAAGGVLRDIAQQHGAVSLTQIMRFVDVGEGAASLGLREGSPDALGFYLDADRVHGHTQLTATTAVFEAWRGDLEEAGGSPGLVSLMLAADRSTVDELNRLGQAEMLRRGVVDHSTVVQLRSDQVAGIGDVVVTRRNDRRLMVTGTDWVKNGDDWMVVGIDDAGGIEVKSPATGRTITLPAAYVGEHVDLGYARTIHAAQGATVTACHTVITGEETRQAFYVAMSRGREANHAYVVVPGVSDAHQAINPSAYTALTPTEVLEGVLARDGSQISATSALRDLADPAVQLRRSTLIFRDALGQALQTHLGDQVVEQIVQRVQLVAGEDVTSDRGWQSLKVRLMWAAAEGGDVDELIAAASAVPLGDARDASSVLLSRIGTIADDRSPWLMKLPAAIAKDDQWGPYLAARSDQVAAAGILVATQTRSRALDEQPRWAQALLVQGVGMDLVADVARFRAAMEISDTDTTPVGNSRLPGDLGVVQRALAERVAREASSTTTSRAVQWPNPAEGQRIMDDPYWPQLAVRLEHAARQGLDVDAMIATALARGPLPAEHAAAALAYRMEGTLPAVERTPVRLARHGMPRWAEAIAAARSIDPRGASLDTWQALQQLSATIPDGAHEQVISDALALMPAQPVVDVDEQLAWMAWKVEQLTTAWAEEEEAPPPAETDPADTPAETGVPASWPEPDPLPATGTSVGRIVELHNHAAAFYRSHYEGSPAAGYVADRFGSDLTDMAGLAIGYAPAEPAALTDHLTGLGATHDELVDAGLAKYSRRGQLVDVFRDRVVVGIHNPDDQLVGFSGRAAPGSTAPKYINTPTTAAFTKGSVLFGLTEGAPDAVIVRAEGVFDAIAITLAGGGHAVGVAPMGTALTDVQVALIAAHSHDRPVLLASDRDSAGQKALAHDYWAFADVGVATAALVLPEGTDDPAQALQQQRDQLELVLTNPEVAPSAASLLISNIAAHPALQPDVIDANKAAAAAKEIAAVIAATPAAEERGDQISEAAAQIPWDGFDELLGDVLVERRAAPPAAKSPAVSAETMARLLAIRDRAVASAAQAAAAPPTVIPSLSGPRRPTTETGRAAPESQLPPEMAPRPDADLCGPDRGADGIER